MFYFKRGLSENQRFLINNKFLIFSVLFFLNIKTPFFFFFFFQENPVAFFTTVFFFKCFHFSPLFFGGFHCWLHFFRSSFFFTLTVSFAGVFCQILLFCVVIPRVLQTRKNLLYPQAFFTLHSFPTFAKIQQVLQIWDRFFCPQKFFTLPSFTTFGTMTCCSNLLTRISWEPTIFPWNCRTSQL